MHLKISLITYFSVCILLLFFGVRSSYALPSLETHVSSPIAVINEPYSVVFDVSWAGDAAAYTSVPPALQVDEWGSVSGITTSTHVEDGKNVIRHTVAILPAVVGDFSIPEVDVPYFSPEDLPEKDENGDAPAFMYPTLHAGVLSVRVNEPADYLLNSVMIAGFGIVLFVFALVFYRRNAVRIARSSDYLEMSVPSMVHDAKKHRLDQDYYAFFQGLLRGSGLLKNTESRGRLQKRFEELALSAGYKGIVPSDDEMDGAVEALETAFRNDGTSSSS